MPRQDVIFNFSGRWIRWAVAVSWFSNFIFIAADVPVSHLVSHVDIACSLLADTFGDSGVTPGTSASRFEVLSSQTVPEAFFFVLRVVQAHSAWCSALLRGSPSTEIRRRSFFSFPCCTQRVASLHPCDSFSHRSHTNTLAWQFKGSAPMEDHTVAFVNHPTLRAKACGLGLLGMSLDLRCRSTVLFCTEFHRQVSHFVDHFTSRAHVLFSFH